MIKLKSRLTYKDRAKRRRETEGREAREARIRAHYAREVATGHMTTWQAAERCERDIRGDNYFDPTKKGERK